MALPPLVEPGPDLSPERTARYARTKQLPGFGPVAQRRLRATRVLVVGAGGLGSAVLPLLASAGFGTIGIVDDDRVEPSNLPRQSIHTPSDVGRPKVESAAEAVRALDDGIELRLYPERLTHFRLSGQQQNNARAVAKDFTKNFAYALSNAPQKEIFSPSLPRGEFNA